MAKSAGKSHFRLRLPKLRLYQQILVAFIAIVMIPLTGVSWLIYQTNQKALKKELGKFIEHSSEAIYGDIKSQMAWQKEHAHLMGTLFLEAYQGEGSFPKAANRVFQLSNQYEAVGIYDKAGKAIDRAYLDFSKIDGERRLPDELSATVHRTQETYQLVYDRTVTPAETNYYLRVVVPTGQDSVPYYVLQKRFDFMQQLIASNNRQLYDRFFIIDHNGVIIAGPDEALTERRQINPEDLRYFKQIGGGVAKEFASKQPTLSMDMLDEPENGPLLEKVFVKMPELGWGILIDSPYQVRQKFIKRAQTQTLLMILACGVVILALSLFYALGVYRNFRQLIKGIKAMADGNYSRKIRLITNGYTPHEIIFLTGEFNRMGRKFSEAWEESQQLTRDLQAANEKLAKLDEMKSNLIDTVSHELRTPLTSIKGYTNRLIRYEGTIDGDTRVKNLKTIKQQADRLGRLVDDLLAIPELEQHTLRVFCDAVKLPDLLERSVGFIQQKEHRPIGIVLAKGLPQPTTVLADPDRLEQIVLNLLDNAVKYSPEGSAIQLSVMPEATDFVAITVSNESDPVEMADLDSLFEKFKRLDESTTRTTRGTGLGLFITKGLVEAMGGRITLGYAEGCFTTTFTLPLYQAGCVLPAELPETNQEVESRQPSSVGLG